MTIFKANESKFIFGGFTTVDWEAPTDSKWKSDANAFLFSLTNKDNQPVKMKIRPNYHEYAIYCSGWFGPIFGFDIAIDSNANTNTLSRSNLGSVYNHPQYALETNEAKSFLTGSYQFQLSEIEVYQKE